MRTAAAGLEEAASVTATFSRAPFVDCCLARLASRRRLVMTSASCCCLRACAWLRDSSVRT
eukprot:scaffold116738_cov64-Phaeocystis_antarctica.AAC.2